MVWPNCGRAVCGGGRAPAVALCVNEMRGVVVIKTRNSRVITVATLAVVCLLGALALAAVRSASGGTGKPLAIPSAGQAPLSASAVAFHDAMRKLWEDHITYTRN
jgi:hypothetical protein